jgi:hypothetical protein
VETRSELVLANQRNLSLVSLLLLLLIPKLVGNHVSGLRYETLANLRQISFNVQVKNPKTQTCQSIQKFKALSLLTNESHCEAIGGNGEFSKFEKRDFDFLEKVVGEENVSIEESELVINALDSFPGEAVKPEVVVWPETTEHVSQIVKYANQHRLPIVSRGQEAAFRATWFHYIME